MYKSDKPENQQDDYRDEDSGADAFAAVVFIMLFVAVATVYAVQAGF